MVRGLEARRWGLLVAIPLVAVALGACKSRRVPAMGTEARAGDVLFGRLPEGRPHQSFTFEGVESSGLDFTLAADVGSQSAPLVRLLDPEGQPVDFSASLASAPGAATMKVRGLILRRNGDYQVTVRPSVPSESVFYSFSHRLNFAPIANQQVNLSAAKPYPVSLTAPRGGLIAVTIAPVSGSNLVPDIRGVKDPWGGRALDRALVPKGANPPRVSHGAQGQMVLTFTAPRPGRYTILASAKAGREGVGTLNAQVRSPKMLVRAVSHPDGSPNFGVPGVAVTPPPATVQPTALEPGVMMPAPTAPPPPPPEPTFPEMFPETTSAAPDSDAMSPPAGPPPDPLLPSK